MRVYNAVGWVGVRLKKMLWRDATQLTSKRNKVESEERTLK